MTAVPVRLCFYLTHNGKVEQITTKDRSRLTTDALEVPKVIEDMVSDLVHEGKNLLPIRATVESDADGSRLFVYVQCVEDLGKGEQDKFKEFLGTISPMDFQTQGGNGGRGQTED